MAVIKEGKEFKMLFDFWSTFLLWKETDIFLAAGISRERCHQFFFLKFSLVYNSQLNSAFHARWLACSEVNSEYYSPPNGQ